MHIKTVLKLQLNHINQKPKYFKIHNVTSSVIINE